MNQLCKVCGEPAAGFHFGAFTCEGCKSFFGRTYNNVSGVSECKNGGRCEITKKNRTSCKSCRLRKCLSVGMSKSGSRYGRRSNWFKIHCLLSAQNQNGMGSPETNNNSSAVANNNTRDGGNNNNNHHHMGKGLGSTLPPLGSLGGHSHSGDRDRDRDRDRERDRDRDLDLSISSVRDRDRDRERERDRDRNGPISLSSASRLSGACPPSFSSLVGLSPESREQFLSSLNRSMVNPELCDYFRAASNNLNLNNNNNNNSKSFYPDDGAEDMSRHAGRSPGSLESPNSEASLDDKSNTPLFSMPPGSPLDVKPSDFSPFDLITRDLMKLGYDPLRLWPALMSAPPNMHSFNPYRLIFPNFPHAAFPGSPFPPNSIPTSTSMPGGMIGSLPPGVGGVNGTNGGIHPAKLLSTAAAISAAAAAENLGRIDSANLSASSPLTPNHLNMNINNINHRRLNSIVPPSSSLTLTPPISTHGADDLCLANNNNNNNNTHNSNDKKFRNVPVQDIPIDLSARSINNNNEDEGDLVRIKGEVISSDMEDDHDDNIDNEHNDNDRENHIEDRHSHHNSDREMGHSDEDEDMMKDVKSEYNDDSEDEDEEEVILSQARNRRRRSHSNRSSCSPKRERVSTPLDLTRSTNNSAPKIAT